jgi:hypothetical protein
MVEMKVMGVAILIRHLPWVGGLGLMGAFE